MNNQKLFELAKGFRGRAKNCLTVTKRRVQKALLYAYRDRRVKRRLARQNWVLQINAGVRQYGMNYSNFMQGMTLSGVKLDRKILSELANYEPLSFRAVTKIADGALKEKQLRLRELNRGNTEFFL
ncbi:50S ribosomal protein L20 [Balamuthia mandrillaris]